MAEISSPEMRKYFAVIVTRAAKRLRGETVLPLPGGEKSEAECLEEIAEGFRADFIKIANEN